MRWCYAKAFHQTAVHIVLAASFNIEIILKYETKQHPIGNIHFSITHGKSNVEIQNSKELQPNQTIRQQLNTAKVIEDQIIQTLNQEALTQIIQVSIKEYLHQLIVAVKK